MEAMCSETSVGYQRTTRRYILEQWFSNRAPQEVATCAANIMKAYFKNKKKPICIYIFIHSLKYINVFLFLYTKWARKVLYVSQCAANKNNLRTTVPSLVHILRLGSKMNFELSTVLLPLVRIFSKVLCSQTPSVHVFSLVWKTSYHSSTVFSPEIQIFSSAPGSLTSSLSLIVPYVGRSCLTPIAETLYACLRMCHVLISGEAPAILTEVFRGFPLVTRGKWP
jgi:hypothetical protein